MEDSHNSNTETRWYYYANCIGENPNMFDGDQGTPRKEIERAKKICRQCPVIAECLIDAIEGGEQYTIRGGLTAGERNNRLRGRQKDYAIALFRASGALPAHLTR